MATKNATLGPFAGIEPVAGLQFWSSEMSAQ